jgi:hypothetical protein
MLVIAVVDRNFAVIEVMGRAPIVLANDVLRLMLPTVLQAHPLV